MQNKNNPKRKTKSIRDIVREMKLETIYIVDFHDIKTESDARSILITHEINLAPVRTLGKLVKKTKIQISLSNFYNLDQTDSEDEDFVHVPIGCIFNVIELRPKR